MPVQKIEQIEEVMPSESCKYQEKQLNEALQSSNSLTNSKHDNNTQPHSNKTNQDNCIQPDQKPGVGGMGEAN